MKIICVALLCFLVQTELTTKAQEFAPVGAEWYYSEGFSSWSPMVESYIKFTSVNDTVIKGVACRRIVKSHALVCQNRPNEEFVYNQHDTVFFYDPDFDEFQILFISNAEPDEKWNIKVLDEQNKTFSIEIKVDSVSTILINNKQLKMLFVTYKRDDEFLNERYSSVIIEKIGDTQFMFNWNPWSTFACDGNYSKGLRCYTDSETGHYATGIANSCDENVYWVNTNAISENIEVLLFPNPAKDFVEINANGDSYNFELYDMQGRLILSEKIKSNHRIDLKSIKKGVYQIILTDKNSKRTSRRLIKD